MLVSLGWCHKTGESTKAFARRSVLRCECTSAYVAAAMMWLRWEGHKVCVTSVEGCRAKLQWFVDVMFLYIHSFNHCGAFEMDRKRLMMREQLASSTLRQKVARNVVTTVTVGFCLETSCDALRKQNHWNCRNQTLKTMFVCVSAHLSRMYLISLSNLSDACNPCICQSPNSLVIL